MYNNYRSDCNKNEMKLEPKTFCGFSFSSIFYVYPKWLFFPVTNSTFPDD